jgi:hypothetical protein
MPQYQVILSSPVIGCTAMVIETTKHLSEIEDYFRDHGYLVMSVSPHIAPVSIDD